MGSFCSYTRKQYLRARVARLAAMQLRAYALGSSSSRGGNGGGGGGGLAAAAAPSHVGLWHMRLHRSAPCLWLPVGGLGPM